MKLVPVEERKSFNELTFRIRVFSSDGAKIRVNLPMPLVKMAMEIGVDVMPNSSGEHKEMLKSIDMEKIIQLVEQGMVGKLVEVESSDGAVIEVVVE